MTQAKHHPDRCSKKNCKSCLFRQEIRCPICHEKKVMFRQARYCSERCRLKGKYKRRKMLGKVATVRKPEECCVYDCHGTPVMYVVLQVLPNEIGHPYPVCTRHRHSQLDITTDGRIFVQMEFGL